MEKKKLEKFLPWIWIVFGITDIADGIHIFLNDPMSARYLGDFFFGGCFVILGIYWYLDINKLSTRPVILSGMFFGMLLSLLAIYRANFITHGYDLASSVFLILGNCIIAICIAISNKFKMGER